MKKSLFTIFTLALLVSCALESEYSLPKDKRIYEELLGTWHPIDAKGSLVFKKNKGKIFSVTMVDEKGKLTLVSPAAFTAKVKNYKLIVLVNTDEGKTINSFYEYRIFKNKFSYRAVRKVDKKFTSDKDLLYYFTENIDKEGFFEDWEDDFYFER
jgi:hypothetical protein